MIAFEIACAVLLYLTIGRAYGRAAWDTWTNCPRTSLRAKLFFPLSCGRPDIYGTFGIKPSFMMPAMAEWASRDGDEEDARIFYGIASFLWPFFVGVGLVNLLIKWPARIALHSGTFALFRLPEMITDAPAGLKAGWRRLLPAKSAPQALAPAPALETTATSLEQSYLQIMERRRQLSVEMKVLDLKEAELAAKLGGPDEAAKLVAMPGRVS